MYFTVSKRMNEEERDTIFKIVWKLIRAQSTDVTIEESEISVYCKTYEWFKM